ncbi:MAG: hypothetical protein NW223_16830 [Hyphomicrobiaceae bacterium]|nr:hypothetical protein [Hyphomicrobiaceae bacterium]
MLRYAPLVPLGLLLAWLCQLILWSQPPVEIHDARAALCLELADWVGDGDAWQFLIDPTRERLPFIMMIRTNGAEQSTHYLESNIMASGPEAARPVGPTYRTKDDAQAAFRKLCQRLGRPQEAHRQH